MKQYLRIAIFNPDGRFDVAVFERGSEVYNHLQELDLVDGSTLHVDFLDAPEDPLPASEAMAKLREMAGKYWDGVEDPDKFIRDMRGRNDE